MDNHIFIIEDNPAIAELLVRVEKVLERTGRLQSCIRVGNVEIRLDRRCGEICMSERQGRWTFMWGSSEKSWVSRS